MPCRDHAKPDAMRRAFRVAPKGYHPPRFALPPGEKGKVPLTLQAAIPSLLFFGRTATLGPPVRGRTCPAARGDPGRDYARAPRCFALPPGGHDSRWGRSEKSAGTCPANLEYMHSSAAGLPRKSRPAPSHTGKRAKIRTAVSYCSRKARTLSPKAMGSFVRRFSTRAALR